MARKRRWFILVLVLSLLGAIILTREIWLPWTDARYPDWRIWLEYNKPWMDAVYWIIPISLALIAVVKFFIGDRSSPAYDKLLPVTTVNAIRNRGIAESELPPWVDRDIVSLDDYRKHPVLLIEGRMKTGKTREAAELIRRAVKDGCSDGKFLFDLQKAERNINPDAIRAGLRDKLEKSCRFVIYYDQLDPYASLKQLEALGEYVRAAKNSEAGHFVTTLRTDHLAANPQLEKWLGDHSFLRIPCKDLDAAKKEEFLVGLLDKKSLILRAEQKEEILRCSKDTPYHLIKVVEKLSDRKMGEITIEEIRKIASKSLEEMWEEERKALITREPAVESLLQALVVFNQAGVNRNRVLVWILAERMERKKHPWRFPGIARLRLNRAKTILSNLAEFGFQENIRVEDVVLEGVSLPVSLLPPQEPRDLLYTFLIQPFRLDNLRDWLKLQISRKQVRETVFELSVSDYYRGAPEKVVEALRWLIRSDSKNAILWYNLGVMLGEQSGRAAEAEGAYRRALEINEKYAAAWNNLGLLLLVQIGRAGEAEDAYRRALAIDKKYAAAWNNLGILLAKQPEQAGEAEDAFKKALAVDNNVAVAWNNLGNLLADQAGRADEAEEAYNKALVIDEKYAEAWFNLGVLLDKQPGRVSEAEDAYNKALVINEKYAQAWYNLGVLLAKQSGRAGEAENAYHKALFIDEKNVLAWNNLGVLLANQPDRVEEVEHAYRQALAIDEKNAKAWFNLGNLLSKQTNREEEAVQAYRQALKINDKDPVAWSNLGTLLARQPDGAKEAEQAYNWALEIDEKYAAAWSNLGALLARQPGRVDEAEDAYHKALVNDENLAVAWSNLGNLLADQPKRVGEAEDAYHKALAIDVKYAQAWSNLGILHRRQQQFEKASVALENAVRLMPESAADHAGLGAVYRKLGLPEVAERELEEARRLSVGKSFYNRACVEALSGHRDAAITLLQVALSNHEISDEWVCKDPDWEDYRGDPEFLRITGCA